MNKKIRYIVFILILGVFVKVSAQNTVETSEKKAGGEITGENIFATTCGRCHIERPPAEFSDAKWKLIMAHMKVRGQLTGREYKLVLDYLQKNN